MHHHKHNNHIFRSSCACRFDVRKCNYYYMTLWLKILIHAVNGGIIIGLVGHGIFSFLPKGYVHSLFGYDPHGNFILSCWLCPLAASGVCHS